jgi:hypothetical protein
MAFELKSVVPWGRNLEEYRLIFNLTEKDLAKKIISVGDGPASFNAEMTRLGYKITSLDPIYAFSQAALRQRIAETREEVLTQTRNNQDNFVWKHIKDVEELERIRMGAMNAFLNDFESGRQQGRYQAHAFPEPTVFPNDAFDLGLSSHFLLLYANLGLDFHLQSITEMMRICREVRIFPLLDLNAQESAVLKGVVNFFEQQYEVRVEPVAYEFQRNGNQMLRIKK